MSYYYFMEKDVENWNAVADEYHRFIKSGDFLREQILNPTILEMTETEIMKDNALKILDAGCGNGYFSRLLQKRGADVVGIDGSPRLIELAKEQFPEIRFLEHDLRNPLPFSDEEFNGIVCNMVLMDFSPIEGTIAEFFRVLKPAGFLVFSIHHPAFLAGKLHKNILQKLQNALPHYDITKYAECFSELRPYTWNKKMEIPYHHRPIEFYLRLLLKNSFTITDFREPVLSPDTVKKKNNYFKLCAKIPPFLIIKATKQVFSN